MIQQLFLELHAGEMIMMTSMWITFLSHNTEGMNNQTSVNQPRFVQLDYSLCNEADEMPDQLDESVPSDNDQPFLDVDSEVTS